MRLALALRYRRILGTLGLVRLEILRRSTRFRDMRWTFLGRPLRLVDSASAYWSIRAIFLDGEYAFKATGPRPRIIDAGANIGLSVLYFKLHHPTSSITAFEADPRIFAVLQENVHTYELDDVHLVNKAIWTRECELDFAADGADGGALVASGARLPSVKVSATRLRPYLVEPVDLLKVDIEGAETDVLEDCADLLGNVKLLFVEYHSRAGVPQTLHRLLGVLARTGFRVSVQPATTVVPQPFLAPSPEHGMDLQLNIFARRVAP